MSVPEPPLRQPSGRPTKTNPTATIAPFGPAPLGVPNFIIEQFEIPPFLLPIYQACGTQYGIPWQVLAGINKIETAFGTNLNVSSAGALGWMQFMPATWKAYGIDANGDGRRDPYNPVDAICSAARYLKANGGDSDIRGALFAYNNAGWYVDEVLLYAQQYGKLPGGPGGLAHRAHPGRRFPVPAKVSYADDITERPAAKRAKPKQGRPATSRMSSQAHLHVEGSTSTRHEGAPVVAVNDGDDRRSIGHNKKLGNYIVLQDDYGNRFTYAELGRVSRTYPVPKGDASQTKEQGLADEGARPRRPRQAARPRQGPAEGGQGQIAGRHAKDVGRRLYALPDAAEQPRAGRRSRDSSTHAHQGPRLRRAAGVLRSASSTSNRSRWACAAAPQGLPRCGGNRPRPHRKDGLARPARQLRHPAGRKGRPEDRSRSPSSTVGSSSRRRRSTGRRARTRSLTAGCRTSLRTC